MKSVFQSCFAIAFLALTAFAFGDTSANSSVDASAAAPVNKGPMQSVPPTRDSQVTMKNYRDFPMSQWAFRNAGAPLNVVMLPRQGKIFDLQGPTMPDLGQTKTKDLQGNSVGFDDLFEANYTNGLVVVQGDKLLHENYFNGFTPHAQHIWFSMSKSLASAAFGVLVAEGKVDLQASPASYIPELKGSGFERVSIQNVLDHATSLDFYENYTDPDSDFWRYYAPALNMGWMPGSADIQPDNAEIYGVHDFLGNFVKPDLKRAPGDNFDYNSSNADVLGWLIARISGQPFQDYVQQNIWAKIGAEHDAYFAVDRAFIPAVTGGMNSTTRDAARFGMLIRDRGQFAGEQVLPTKWVDASLELSETLRTNMSANSKYQEEPWQAYHNMWWILDADAGEYCAVGIHGQVIYINRKADTVMTWFSSQPGASAAKNLNFRVKLKAARELALSLTP